MRAIVWYGGIGARDVNHGDVPGDEVHHIGARVCGVEDEAARFFLR